MKSGEEEEGTTGVKVETTFISAGCNRVVNAAAWGPPDLVAFGAHNAVAIFCPKTAEILQTLRGHKDFVNCVEWLPRYQMQEKDTAANGKEQYLLSGCADGAIILWAFTHSKKTWRKVMQVPNSHEKAVSCLAGVMVSSTEAVFISSSSDCTVRLWAASLHSEPEGDAEVSFKQSIPTGTRAVIALSITLLPASSESFLMALGGLDNHIYLYCGTREGQFVRACILKGHQDWIRCLDFSLPTSEGGEQILYLASCGQDRNVRIWKISSRDSDANRDLSCQIKEKSVSIKMYIEGPVFKAGPKLWQASMESLLVGHDDWVYSVKWQPPVSNQSQEDVKQVSGSQCMSILSASMDRTMMIWKPEPSTGLWINEVTVGELGHTALGFFGGLWSPSGDSIMAHAFGGSFHIWQNAGTQWKPQLVPSGHSSSVVDIAWAKTGQFLLSASHDQTTRLFAPWDWKRFSEVSKTTSWHELARPQVHGHDLNCLAVLRGKGNHRYVSGAEEKVARVFEAPASFLKTLEHVKGDVLACNEMVKPEDVKVLGANMSALGLSQKPIYSAGNQNTKDVGIGVESIESVPDAVPAVLVEPPFEEHLAWNTLWPESNKLYGHGNELFSMCCDHRGHLLATSCKAQSASVAEIWLWETTSWRAIGQLRSHTLTVTQMEFSHSDKFLLSVSRDRHFSVFEATQSKGLDEPPYKLVSRVEAHKRIIWACSWSPCDSFFATGSRDKSVKFWAVGGGEGTVTVKQTGSLPPFRSSVTALAWAPQKVSTDNLLAVGTEEGLLELWKAKPIWDGKDKKLHGIEHDCLYKFDAFSCHVASVNRLVWSERSDNNKQQQEEAATGFQRMQLASCGADHTVRLFTVECT